MSDRRVFEAAVKRRRRHRQQLEARRDASTAPVVLYAATMCVHQLAAVCRVVERAGGGWLTLFIDRFSHVQLLTTRPFCDGINCDSDHVAFGRALAADIRRQLARQPRFAERITTGGRWPWPLLPSEN